MKVANHYADFLQNLPWNALPNTGAWVSENGFL